MLIQMNINLVATPYDGSVGKNINVFEADMSSSVHIYNKNKDTLILDEGTT